MDDLDNRLERIQAVFFPGLFDDDILAKTRVDEGEQTCVEMLAGPSCELRDVLRELVFYSDDAQVTAYAAPELIPLLRHSSPAVAEKATGIGNTRFTYSTVTKEIASFMFKIARKRSKILLYKDISYVTTR